MKESGSSLTVCHRAASVFVASASRSGACVTITSAVCSSLFNLHQLEHLPRIRAIEVAGRLVGEHHRTAA